MKKKLSIQNIFCFSSLIFILTCIFWYGGRFIYFYLENQEQLKQNNKIFYSIVKDNNLNSENFKKINKTYYFTGNTNNNYVNYSNLLWRIVKINEDKGIPDEKYYLSEKLLAYCLSPGTKNFMHTDAKIDLPVARALLSTMGNSHRSSINNYVTTNGRVRALTEREAH